MSKRAIFWFRRDLRLGDNPALLAAFDEADEVVPLFVMDDEIADRAGAHRRAYLAASLKALDASMNGALHVISGDPVEVLARLTKKYGANSIHCAFPFAPYGNALDERLKKAGIELTQLGSGYAVAPGRVLKDDGTPYRVYTPFYRAWSAHGWRKPVAAPKDPKWVAPTKADRQLPDWDKSEKVTSRDYYDAKFKKMRYDKPGKKFEAWCEGRTGYPFVDAAMRQLVKEGWMHNRTRMVVASFLVKDLHIEWQHGANFFMKYLIDNDVASNSHGWQWTAGCGTDASPYYRVFNPIEQGRRFDPEGVYIKRYIPELAHLSGDDIHEPWTVIDGLSKGYPEPIVDHAKERLESLARLEEIKAAKPIKPN
ncbi:MAG: deoxyribodipyrimidine photo-lyase [Actinobacteria bacterium]|nr:deoxyribodipyrimidine photo-lyase [Actinomycetota bacterium]